MIDFSKRPGLSIADLPDPADFSSFHPFLRGVFSQWHPTPIEIEGCTYSSAEQWMMHAKACLFSDNEAAHAILRSSDPAEQKRLGQQVRNFEITTWEAWRIDIVHRGSWEKFSQNPGAARQLRNTGESMLVEANPRDWNWGNGLQIDDPANSEPARWHGRNLLGRILTKIRDEMVSYPSFSAISFCRSTSGRAP